MTDIPSRARPRMLCPSCGRLVAVVGSRTARHKRGDRDSSECRDSGKDTLMLFGRGLREKELKLL